MPWYLYAGVCLNGWMKHHAGDMMLPYGDGDSLVVATATGGNHGRNVNVHFGGRVRGQVNGGSLPIGPCGPC